MKSTNMLERLNQDQKRRTFVVRLFPNLASCLRLTRALASEVHERWLVATRHLNMKHLKEAKKENLRALAACRRRRARRLNYGVNSAPATPKAPTAITILQNLAHTTCSRFYDGAQ